MRTLDEMLADSVCAVLQLLLVVALGLAIRRTAKYLAPPPSPPGPSAGGGRPLE
jgi:hypothetical protein